MTGHIRPKGPYNFATGQFCPQCLKVGEELGKHMKTFSVATGFFSDDRMWVWDGKEGTEVWPRKN